MEQRDKANRSSANRALDLVLNSLYHRAATASHRVLKIGGWQGQLPRMAQATFIVHQGKQILYIDFSDCSPQDVIDRIRESGRVIQSQPEGSVLTLTYVRNARFDRKVTQALKEYTQQNKPYVRAAAVVGMSGLMQVILHAIIVFTRRRFATFDSLDEAKDWLVRH